MATKTQKAKTPTETEAVATESKPKALARVSFFLKLAIAPLSFLAVRLANRDNDKSGADDVTASFIHFSIAGIKAVLYNTPLPDVRDYILSKVSTAGFISPEAALYIGLAAPALEEVGLYLRNLDKNKVGTDDKAATTLLFIADGLNNLVAGEPLPAPADYFEPEAKTEANALLNAEL